MTPFEISILMHYHTRPGDFRGGDVSAPLVRPTLDHFVRIGLLRRTDSPAQHYASTDATKVYIDAICSVPAPVQRWVMPEGAATGNGGAPNGD